MLLTIGMFPLLTVPIRVSHLVRLVVASDTAYEPKHGVRGSWLTVRNIGGVDDFEHGPVPLCKYSNHGLLPTNQGH